MERVSFWSHERAGDGLLSLLFARLFRVALDKEVSVKDCYVWVGDKVSCVVRFRRVLHPFESVELESLWSLLSNVFICRNEADSRVWKPKPSAPFLPNHSTRPCSLRFWCTPLALKLARHCSSKS